MENANDGAHTPAGQSCPAASPSSEIAPDIVAGANDGGVMRVFEVSPEKLAVIETILDDEKGGLPKGQRRDKSKSGSKEIPALKLAGMKLAGLFIIAACVTGELSAEAHVGQSIHAHGGHENKRSVVRRGSGREKIPKPEKREAEIEGPKAADGKLELGDGRSESGCQNRVDLCENRSEDGVCLIRQQSCLWTAKEIGDGSWELGQKLLDLESAMKNGFQRVFRK